jgi:hypothetical protein
MLITEAEKEKENLFIFCEGIHVAVAEKKK